MAIMNVNPTRMELTKLKKRLVVAVRGHKLLKDKRDELMRQFLNLIRENKALRESVEKGIEKANQHFIIASSVMQDEVMSAALMVPKQEVAIDISFRNVMSVSLPVMDIKSKSSDESDIYSYGYAATSSDLDDAVKYLSQVQNRMLRLAEKEKACQLLASEIEKTRRRVNALEYVMIPDLQDTIKFITMKLEENERSTVTRLMKVKDMMIAEEFEKKHNKNQ